MSTADISASVKPVRLLQMQLPQKRAHEVGGSIYVKRGTRFKIHRGADAMRFVRCNTSIPIPCVIELHLDEDDTNDNSWFSMSKIPGCSLESAWPTMTEEARAATQAGLRDYLNELRALPPPKPVYIGSHDGGPAYDHRLNNGFPCGPFASESDFNDFLVAPVARCPRKERVNYYRQQLIDSHEIVFTHADLGGDHIFVEPKTGRITGMIDWEMAGWWPEYWEYTKSRFGSRCQAWWKTLIAQVLHPYEHERGIEHDLQNFC